MTMDFQIAQLCVRFSNWIGVICISVRLQMFHVLFPITLKFSKPTRLIKCPRNPNCLVE